MNRDHASAYNRREEKREQGAADNMDSRHSFVSSPLPSTAAVPTVSSPAPLFHSLAPAFRSPVRSDGSLASAAAAALSSTSPFPSALSSFLHAAAASSPGSSSLARANTGGPPKRGSLSLDLQQPPSSSLLLRPVNHRRRSSDGRYGYYRRNEQEGGGGGHSDSYTHLPSPFVAATSNVAPAVPAPHSLFTLTHAASSQLAANGQASSDPFVHANRVQQPFTLPTTLAGAESSPASHLPDVGSPLPSPPILTFTLPASIPHAQPSPPVISPLVGVSFPLAAPARSVSPELPVGPPPAAGAAPTASVRRPRKSVTPAKSSSYASPTSSSPAAGLSATSVPLLIRARKIKPAPPTSSSSSSSIRLTTPSSSPPLSRSPSQVTTKATVAHPTSTHSKHVELDESLQRLKAKKKQKDELKKEQKKLKASPSSAFTPPSLTAAPLSPLRARPLVASTPPTSATPSSGSALSASSSPSPLLSRSAVFTRRASSQPRRKLDATLSASVDSLPIAGTQNTIAHTIPLPTEPATPLSPTAATASPSASPSPSPPPPSSSSSSSLTLALDQAKAAKSRLQEHRARQKADSAKLQTLTLLVRREKELLAEREQQAKLKRRSEIYAINHMKRLFHEEMFAKFMQQLAAQAQADKDAPATGGQSAAAATATFSSEVASV